MTFIRDITDITDIDDKILTSRRWRAASIVVPSPRTGRRATVGSGASVAVGSRACAEPEGQRPAQPQGLPRRAG
ncbi:hypothetical protein ITP53_20890 [Nonomuraea sp. K274]|uniref:Uncharacterized protein n=1 Tax=Nonomuraea cypriaca TaxID=1187855 RepID=A0A931ADF1_9ACTN|nr:hypothetical protein [Nonomuraea cypriaca]